ncbi:hypothetical protein EPN44_05220 [bacterium]|nr:MAG: hypothetical protein EPN44_05220 [bacterium]
MFTEVGQLPSIYDPRTAWISSQIISLNNASWLFASAPSDVTGPGTDAAGVYTPCSRCSIAKVDTIAQSGTSTYSIDGSFFGVDVADEDTISWNQMAFGEWGSDCYNGTNLCTFYVSPNPLVYYGGPQNYPNAFISQANLGPTGYGPYQSYDGLSVNGSRGDSIARSPQGSFAEPLPPTTSPVSLSLAADGFSSGGCSNPTYTRTVGPIPASQMSWEGTLDPSSGNVILAAPFQNTFVGLGISSPGVFTDQASWNNLLAQTGSLAGTTEVNVSTTVSVSSACGGG